MDYLLDNLWIFDNLTMGTALGPFQLLSPTSHAGREDFCSGLALPARFQNGTPGRHYHNSNVVNILPVTTLRTIDLGGKKISGPLFSRFCTKTECFF
jgi:hypothetical protein